MKYSPIDLNSATTTITTCAGGWVCTSSLGLSSPNMMRQFCAKFGKYDEKESLSGGLKKCFFEILKLDQIPIFRCATSMWTLKVQN